MEASDVTGKVKMNIKNEVLKRWKHAARLKHELIDSCINLTIAALGAPDNTEKPIRDYVTAS